MWVVFHSLFQLNTSEPSVRYTIGHPVPFAHSVLKTKFHRIYLQLISQLVDRTLDCKPSLWLASTVSNPWSCNW